MKPKPQESFTDASILNYSNLRKTDTLVTKPIYANHTQVTSVSERHKPII